MTCPTNDPFAVLHLAGWSLDELCFGGLRGLRWHVTACRDGVTVRGVGATQAEAWRRRGTRKGRTADVVLLLATVVFLACIWLGTVHAGRTPRWRPWHAWAIGLPAIGAPVASLWSDGVAAGFAVASALVLLALHGTGRMWFWFAMGTASAVAAGLVWLLTYAA